MGNLFYWLMWRFAPSTGSFSSTDEASCREMLVCLVHRRLSISVRVRINIWLGKVYKARQVGITNRHRPGRMESRESKADASSPLPVSPELRKRNKRKETTHYQRASLWSAITTTFISLSLKCPSQHTHTHTHPTFCFSLNTCPSPDFSFYSMNSRIKYVLKDRPVHHVDSFIFW